MQSSSSVKPSITNQMENNSNFDIFELDVVDTTMNEMKKYAKTNELNFFAVNTKEMTAGRGSSNRKWSSSIIGNLYTTFGMKTEWIPSHLWDIFPIIVGECAIEAWNELEGDKHLFFLKYPNDLICLDNSKIGGIWVEDYENYKSIGIGINIVAAPDSGIIRENGWKACFIKEHIPLLKVNAVELTRIIGNKIFGILNKDRKFYLDKWEKLAKKDLYWIKDSDELKIKYKQVKLNDEGNWIAVDDNGNETIFKPED